MNEQKIELYEKFSRLQWLLQRHHMHQHNEHGPLADPTRGQGRVLAILKLQPEISVKDLSYLLGIRTQSLNELLIKLEKNGFISRSPSETDKRAVVVHLTEKGKNDPQRDLDFGNIFDGLDAEEQKLFGEYLDRVIATLEAQFGNAPDGAEFDLMAAAKERLMTAARGRFGEKMMFDKLLSLRHRGPAFGGAYGRGEHGEHEHGGHEHCEHEHCEHGHGEYGHEGHGTRGEFGDRGEPRDRGEFGDRGEPRDRGEFGACSEPKDRDGRGDHGNRGDRGDRGNHGDSEGFRPGACDRRRPPHDDPARRGRSPHHPPSSCRPPQDNERQDDHHVANRAANKEDET